MIVAPKQVTFPLESIFYYVHAYKAASNFFKSFLPNQLNDCLDPIIPLTQFFYKGTHKTDQFDDLIIAVIAGSAEDINLNNSTLNTKTLNFANSMALKALIKDSSKILCKSSLGSFIYNKSLISFSCELVGSMTSATAKQILNNDQLNMKFLLPTLAKSFFEAGSKVVGNYAKKLIENFSFDEKYIAAEYGYRIIGNGGKLIYSENIESSITKYSYSQHTTQEVHQEFIIDLPHFEEKCDAWDNHNNYSNIQKEVCIVGDYYVIETSHDS